MTRKWFGIAALILTATVLLSLSSCARSQRLQGITISPSAFTYFSPAPAGVQQTPIPLTAYGSYIHPAETKDISSQVTWASDNTIVADVSSAGQLTDGVACGVANISATFFTNGNKSGNLVVGFMTVTVQGPASQGCPQGTATNNLSVDVTAGAADGVIVSAPAGINCGSTCSAAFPANSSVSLTATPISGKQFIGWASGCTTTSGLTCNVTLNSDVTVSASFN
jgi:hypothetical protein